MLLCTTSPSLLRNATVRVAAPSIRFVQGFALASCWPLPQQLLPVSAAGGGRRRCLVGEALAYRCVFERMRFATFCSAAVSFFPLRQMLVLEPQAITAKNESPAKGSPTRGAVTALARD